MKRTKPAHPLSHWSKDNALTQTKLSDWTETTAVRKPTRRVARFPAQSGNPGCSCAAARVAKLVGKSRHNLATRANTEHDQKSYRVIA